MTVFRNLLLVIILLSLSSSCSKKEPTITVLNDPANFKHIIYFNNDRLTKDTKSWEISKKDFVLIDSLLQSKSLMSTTETINGIEPFKRKIHESLLNNYYKQYIPYIDKNGDRILYINAACHKAENWETDLIIFRDGGDCYWNVKVNLNQKIMYEFGVNSIA